MGPLRRVKLTQLNAHLVCVLCSGYFVDATTIIECLHTFCKTCIVRYLQTSSFCPICDVQVHKTKPLLSLREDRTLQDVVFKLVPGLFHSEMKRRYHFYKEHPEGGGDKTEQSLRERRHFFHVDDQISLSLEHVTTPPYPTQTLVHPHLVKPLKVNNGQQGKQQKSPSVQEEKNEIMAAKEEENEARDDSDDFKVVHKRYLRCPAAVQVSHLEKFVRLKYNLSRKAHKVEIMHGGDCLMGELTLLDVVYMYKWTEDAPLRLTFTVSIMPQSRKRPRMIGSKTCGKLEPGAPPCKAVKLHPSTPDIKVIPSVVNASLKDSSKRDKIVKAESKDEKSQDKVTAVQTSAVDSPYIGTNRESASLNSDTNPNSTVMQTSSIMSCNTVGGQILNARVRPALTTTTPANATPRVALTQMSSQTPSPTTGPVVPPTTVAPNLNEKTLFNSATSIPATKLSSLPVVNGLNDCRLKQVHTNSPNLLGNRIPHSIIPTRPRLGRPPNPSRLNAMKMRPRMPLPNIDVRTRPPSNKVYSGSMPTRPNNIVSTSLNVQNRLSSISGPPGKLMASKVSVKRPSDTMVKDGAMPPQHTSSVTTINSSTSSTTTTTTTHVSSTYTIPKTCPPTIQSLSSSPVSTNKVSNNAITNVQATKTTPLLQQGTLVRERQAPRPRIVQMEESGQRPKQQSARPFLNPSLRPTTPHMSRHLSPHTAQRYPSPHQSCTRSSTPPTKQGDPIQASHKPTLPQQQSQGNTQLSSPQMMQQPTSQEMPPLLTGPLTTGSPAVLTKIRPPLSPNNPRPSNTSGVRPHLALGTQRPDTPVTIRSPMNLGSPIPHRHPSSCTPHSPSNTSPALHSSTGTPAPCPPSSPAPHRLPGNTTPCPSSTPIPPSAQLPSPRSTPSPRCTSSSPSPATVPTSSMMRDGILPLSISSPTNSAAPSNCANTNSTTQGSKSSETSSLGQVISSTSNTIQTPPTKIVSPGTGKTTPKSPGRVRGTNSSPSILSIAQSLANKHLQQRTTTVSPTNNTAVTSISIGTAQINQQTYTPTTTTSVYPGSVPVPASSLVPLAAAYMASTYGDSSPDVTAMRNLITLSQTAACIRELNLAAMVKNFPRPNDPAPIDLSPTSKAAPQTPLTNGKPVMGSSCSTTTTKTTNSKSPAKIPRPCMIPSMTTATAPTISPPTPEVTITKLPNTSATTTSITPPVSTTTKTIFGSAKLGSSNTNTVSITKRPASSKIAITKSPANASVRQIPNPSFVRHQSEARNNNNVSKPPSTSISGSQIGSAVTTNSTNNVTNKQSGVGRGPGNSPIKETGPLPKTSSILEIENLTRSLAAPAAAAAASHGFNFLNNR